MEERAVVDVVAGEQVEGGLPPLLARRVCHVDGAPAVGVGPPKIDFSALRKSAVSCPGRNARFLMSCLRAFIGQRRACLHCPPNERRPPRNAGAGEASVASVDTEH